jgi:hypothetical protein
MAYGYIHFWPTLHRKYECIRGPGRPYLYILVSGLVEEEGVRVVFRVGQNHIHRRCTYGIFGLEITKYAVIYNVYTLYTYIYTVMANLD